MKICLHANGRVTIQRMNPIPPLVSDSGAEHAAHLLCSPENRIGLTLKEARVVIRYMQPRFYTANTVFIREGNTGDGGFMALLIEGDVVVERVTTHCNDPATVKVLGPGSLIGEMGLVNKEPRSASCIADSDIWCAVLTRQSIETMIAREPMVAARLLMGVSANIAVRLRDTNRQLKLFARLAGTLRDELMRSPAPVSPR